MKLQKGEIIVDVDQLVKMSKGVPGAAVVLTELAKIGAIDEIQLLDRLKIHGSQIWVLYKDFCNENIYLLKTAITETIVGNRSEQDLIKASVDN